MTKGGKGTVLDWLAVYNGKEQSVQWEFVHRSDPSLLYT